MSKSKTGGITLRDISERLEEPLQILRIYLDRAIYTHQDINEDFFNRVDYNPEDMSQAWMLTSQYRRFSSKSDIVDDSLLHIKDARLALDSIENWIDEAMHEAEAAEKAVSA